MIELSPPPVAELKPTNYPIIFDIAVDRRRTVSRKKTEREYFLFSDALVALVAREGGSLGHVSLKATLLNYSYNHTPKQYVGSCVLTTNMETCN